MAGSFDPLPQGMEDFLAQHQASDQEKAALREHLMKVAQSQNAKAGKSYLDWVPGPGDDRGLAESDPAFPMPQERPQMADYGWSGQELGYVNWGPSKFKTLPDAVLTIRKEPTDQNLEWFDKAFGKGAAGTVLQAIESPSKDTRNKLEKIFEPKTAVKTKDFSFDPKKSSKGGDRSPYDPLYTFIEKLSKTPLTTKDFSFDPAKSKNGDDRSPYDRAYKK